MSAAPKVLPKRGRRRPEEYRLTEEYASVFNGATTTRYIYEGHGRRGSLELDRGANGALIAERWSLAGELHREDGPAEIAYHPDGTVKFAAFMLHGNHHRLDGPALVQHGPDGSMERAEWLVGGWSRSGPAEIAGILDGWSRYGLLNEVPGVGLPLAEMNEKTNDEIRDALISSSFGELLDEGMPPAEIAGFVRDGVETTEGIRAVLGGAPAEWVRSYEEGRS